MTTAPALPLVADTHQIVKDITRKQLTVAAPQVEEFSGNLDDKAPAGLTHLGLEGPGFATVVLVANDHRALAESRHLIISRTGLDASNVETKGPILHLRGLKKPSKGQHWYLVATRPRALATDKTGLAIVPTAEGNLDLPMADWRECELHLRNEK